MNFLRALMRGRMAGHPVHAMLVHFPSALFPFAFIFDLIGFLTGDISFTNAATYCLAATVVMAAIAAVFGAIDLLKIDPDSPAWRIGILHGLLSFCWLLTWGVLLGLKVMHHPVQEPVGVIYLVITAALVIGLFFTNFLGGELLLKYGIGNDYTNSDTDK